MEDEGLTLVVWNLVTGFVHAHERKVPVLANLTVFITVDGDRNIAGVIELLLVSVVDRKRNGLASEPDVICQYVRTCFQEE